MGFARDLKVGNIGQRFVIDLLAQANISAFENEDRRTFPHYDILISFAEKKWTAEVKYDLYAEKSGNIAIEYYNPKSNKPSGLSITKADFWIHVLTNPDKAFIVRTDQFKDFISKHKPHRLIPRGGDGNASLMLYKADFMTQNIFIPITPSDIKDTLEIITNGFKL